MDLSLQAKLLRVLQEREVTRIGGNQTIKLDVRIIAATPRSCRRSKGRKFREFVLQIARVAYSLPPLRERGNDVLL